MHFVIDLNIIRSAWNGVGPSGALEQHSAILLLQVVRKCHRFAVTKEIDQRYQCLFDELKNAPRQGPDALNVVRLYYTAKQIGKVDDSRYSSDVPPLPDESHIKDEDRYFVRLANLIKAILVTYDEPLIRKLMSIGVKAVKPDDAVKLVDR